MFAESGPYVGCLLTIEQFATLGHTTRWRRSGSVSLRLRSIPRVFHGPLPAPIVMADNGAEGDISMEARSRRGSLDHLGIDGQLVEPTDPAHAGGGPLRLFHNRSYAGGPGEEACRTAGREGVTEQ